jgi:hypothetical protein
MIVQSTRIVRKGGIRYLARHLLDKPLDNDLIEVLAGDRTALDDALALAKIKGCRYAVRHLSISPEREMTPAQLSSFLKSVDAEFHIGTQRPRLIVRHVKNGRSHFHLAVAEVDPENLRVLDCRNDFRRLEDLARQYEQEHGETVQLLRSSRRKQRVQGFSDLARKKAERVAPKFDRTRLNHAATKDRPAFLREVSRQGLRIAQGDKGLILVSATGSFVAAANRAAGMSRSEFQKLMNEGVQLDHQSGPQVQVPGDPGARRPQPYAAFTPSGSSRGAPGPRQDCATAGVLWPHSGGPKPTGHRAQASRRENRSHAASITRFRERLFLHRLTKLDLDDLLRRALEFGALIRAMFEPEPERLKRHIAEARKPQRVLSQTQLVEEDVRSYSFVRRITP